MSKESLSTTAKKALIITIMHEIWPWLLGILSPALVYFLSLSSGILKDPLYKILSPILLAVLLCTTILFGIWWARLYIRFGRLHLAYGVLWDKELNMHCTDCHKFLKHSSYASNIFHCSDIKCDNKHVLKDDDSNPLTKQQAIDLLQNKNPR